MGGFPHCKQSFHDFLLEIWNLGNFDIFIIVEEMPYEWIILSFSSCAHYWCSLTANMCQALIRIDFMRLDFDTNVSCNKCVSHLASFFFLLCFCHFKIWKRNRCSTWLDIVLIKSSTWITMSMTSNWLWKCAVEIDLALVQMTSTDVLMLL